jgi:uncharacterized RDD family membrane protein YckC
MKNTYATLFDRVKAACVDSVILIAGMYTASEIFSLLENVPSYLRIVVFALIFVFYDPFFTSRYGATIGHSIVSIKVRRGSESEKNLSFFKALLRFVVKVTLGWISLLSIILNKKSKAIHDFAANSIVVELNKE